MRFCSETIKCIFTTEFNSVEINTISNSMFSLVLNALKLQQNKKFKMQHKFTKQYFVLFHKRNIYFLKYCVIPWKTKGLTK